MDKINPNIKSLTLSDGRSYTVRNNRDRFFYPTEWMKFFDVLKSRQKITFDCLISTGARINEIRNVFVGDVDFVNKRLILRVTKVKAKAGEKNPRPRTIPLSTQFIRRLKGYVSGKSNDEKIGILSTPAANIGMKLGLQRAGISDWEMFSVHNVRKTMETWLLALDVGEGKLSKHMGHNIATMIQHYVSPDVFSWEEKKKMREILGDMYQR